MANTHAIVEQPGYDQGQNPVHLQQVQTVIVMQPEAGAGPNKMLIPMHGNRAWSTGVCDCMEDLSTCLLVAFCTPCMQCRFVTRMGENACVPCCVPGAMIALRQRLRTLGGIQGTLCNDCLTMTCCGHCALCQMMREMDIMGIM